jgi:GT2 family glycosyltransferase
VKTGQQFARRCHLVSRKLVAILHQIIIENDMPASSMKIAVGIATLGRREVLAKTIDVLSRQTRLPDMLVICAGGPEDADEASLKNFPAATRLVTGTIGLCAQRNKILAAVAEADIVVFFDDDFFPESGYLANLGRVFTENSDVVAATGFLLADGVNGPGLSVQQALKIGETGSCASVGRAKLIDYYGTYGCNMAFRMETVRRNGVLFDENLPLYGWQEDIDFSLRLAPFGRIVKCQDLRGVHLGVKLGRTSGIRFGYSQIANPVYLVRKGSIAWRYAMNLMWRNIAANLVRSFYPEPWIDRKGRLKGNVLALIDVAIGRVSPLRIRQFR